MGIWFLWTILIVFGIAFIFGIALSLANKYLEVKEDERINDVEKLLPGYNCGACGTAGCHDFAVGIIEGEVENLSRCKPGKKDKNFEPIIEYLNQHPNEDGQTINVKI